MSHWTEQVYKHQSETFAPILEEVVDYAEQDVENLLSVLEKRKGSRPEQMLDIGCGIGRHVLCFSERGICSEGIDLSPDFINRARRRAKEREIHDLASFYVHDMRNLDEWNPSYDLITSFWDSFNYFGRETELTILTEINRLLSDDGTFVIDMGNKENMIKNFDPCVVREVGNRLHIQRMEFDARTSRLQSTIDIFSIESEGYEYVDTMELERRLYSPTEFRRLCQDAGFEDVTLLSGEFEELTFDSTRLVVLAC